MLELGRSFRYTVKSIGSEQQPLLVIDNLLADAFALIDAAMSSGAVAPARGVYPGLRSTVGLDYGQFLRSALASILADVFGCNAGQFRHSDSYYSLVATPTAQLSGAQRLPHYDRAEPQALAVIHYLCDARHGGTGFYRHRQTGFEYVDSTREPGYLRALENEVKVQGLPEPAAYMCGDNQLFERIASEEAGFNKALIYRCSSLHSGNIGSDYTFDLNPRSGRFTIASFLHNG